MLKNKQLFGSHKVGEKEKYFKGNFYLCYISLKTMKVFVAG